MTMRKNKLRIDDFKIDKMLQFMPLFKAESTPIQHISKSQPEKNNNEYSFDYWIMTYEWKYKGWMYHPKRYINQPKMRWNGEMLVIDPIGDGEE